jgi:hypothetical protein
MFFNPGTGVALSFNQRGIQKRRRTKMADIKKIEKRASRPATNEGDCVWTDAGVILSRLCDHDDCHNCLFDLGVREALGSNDDDVVSHIGTGWKEYLKSHFKGGNRPCFHALAGRVEGPKLCTFNYECYHCPYDQMLDEMEEARSRVSV